MTAGPASHAPEPRDRELLSRLTALRDLTRTQLEAARTLDVGQLAALNERRDELLFDVQLLIDEGLPIPAADRGRVRALGEEVLRLESRLVVVSRAVLALVGGAPDPDTYDRLGRVGLAG